MQFAQLVANHVKNTYSRLQMNISSGDIIEIAFNRSSEVRQETNAMDADMFISVFD
jgi:hypothetical protein